MSLTVAFVIAFALLCVGVSGLAIVRLWKAVDFPHRWLWMLGSPLGFVGFAVDPRSGNDLLFNVGVQIPVVYGMWTSAKGLALKAMFPVIAVVALERLERHRARRELPALSPDSARGT